ncbi:Holliday junction resolvase RuvX [Candidatus Parcubacteria bacterium]|nr:Holliday junction resolvase RuvX [Candidatus Parcubacteria bacterium]MBI4098961.1 Holliday junction resolvase RuvX [Candidatus Parcubacteria bacterium]MBI4385373.1 Holliday junction resolvase RuvX [Candidatus Parcubacteria bacterium]
MRILAIDYGLRRFGLAVSDEGRSFAFSRGAMAADGSLLTRLAELCRSEKIGEIIVGWPRSLSGQERVQAMAVARFIERLRAVVSLPIKIQDERFSTALARRKLRGSGRRISLDAASAVTILESYLVRSRSHSNA